MNHNTGMMDLDTLKAEVNRGDIETVLTVFPDLYGRLVGKRITGRFFVDEVVPHGMHACDYLLACDMEMDPVPGYRFTSWESGYGDVRCLPDLKTLRRAAWLDRTALVLCNVFNEEEDVPVSVAPRNILRRQMESARELGYIPMGGSELEFFIFKETYETAHQKHYHDLQTSGWYIEDYHILQGTKMEDLVGRIRRAMDRSGVPVEFSKGEWGPGQHEINLCYADFMEMADRHVIYKHAAKEIALQQDMAVTFMAKWDERMAGSSMHLHASLWDAEGKQNLFSPHSASPARGEESPISPPSRLVGMGASPPSLVASPPLAGGAGGGGPVRGSDLFRWFLGGWMAHAREFALFYAPYVNSYKRYQAGTFAPTGIAWSYDNRTACFRIVGHGNSLRIECRIPGADANPYLAFAATLAAGLDGIARQTEPPAHFEGDVYTAQGLLQLPKTLHEAMQAFGVSELARQAFGEEVVEHYLHFARTEQRKFDEVVTCWERARFFERA